MAADRGRSTVYEAEQQISDVLDRGGVFDFYGSHLSLPRQRRFTDLLAVQSYLDHVRTEPWAHGHTPRPVVQSTRSLVRASWSEPSTIRIPDHQAWAMREMVILHEYAHHVAFHSYRATGHQAPFRRVFVEFVAHTIGPEAEILLRAAFDQAGLAMTQDGTSKRA